jgi:hypothetical protein
MSNSVLGAVLLGTGMLAVFLLRARDGQERRIVQFPAAWIIVGLFLTCWIGTGVALIAAGVLGL